MTALSDRLATVTAQLVARYGVPVVTAPAPPVITQPPAGAGLSGLQLIGDDWTGYADTAALRNAISANVGGTGDWRTAKYGDGPNAGLAEIDESVQYNGHHTVKYNQPGGTSMGPEMWPSFPGGKTLTNMWFRAVIRFSPGFTTYGVTPNCANAYKLLGWGWQGMDGRGGLGFTNTTDYTFTWGLESAGANLGFTEPTGFRKVTTEWTDGAWYDYVIHYEQTSSTTTRTTFYLGRNDAAPQLVYVMDGTANPGVTVPPVNRVMLGLNFNSTRTPSQNQALWYGEWEVVDGSQYANPFDLPVVIAPAPPVIVPPVVVQPAAGAGLSGLQLIGDDWTGYADTAALRNAISTNVGGTGDWHTAKYGDGPNAGLAEIDESVQYNGHHTVRYPFTPEHGHPELWPGLPTRLDHMFFRAKIRFAPGFTTVGNNAGASNAYKLLGWGLAGCDGSGRIEITNTTQYELYWGATRGTTDATGKTTTKTLEVEEKFGYPGFISTEWTAGEWWDYIIEWKKTSDSTVDTACWIQKDGTVAPRAATTTTTMIAGELAPQVNSVLLGLNYNQPIMASMSLNYGQWEVVDGSAHSNPFNLADVL